MSRSIASVCASILAVCWLSACDSSEPAAPDAGSEVTDAARDASEPQGCAPPAEVACAMPAPDEWPVSIEADTLDHDDDHSGSGCNHGGGLALDVAYQFTAPSAARYVISTVGSEFDTVLSVWSGCGGEELACNDDIDPDVEPRSRLRVTLDACETVIVVVDGVDSAEAGAVRLSIETAETACADGLDDDGDGLTDCDDEDCFGQDCVGGLSWPEAWAELEEQVLVLTNERRAEGAICDTDEFGPAPPLEMNSLIRVAARRHSLDMGQQNFFMHDSLDGRTFSDRMEETGFMGASPWGENIAAGSTTAADVVQGWMDSPGHCRNIMNPEFRTIGVGYAYVASSVNQHYWTQDFAAGH